jgi:phosphopantetheinyl transferase (holo-ACP synthase)
VQGGVRFLSNNFIGIDIIEKEIKRVEYLMIKKKNKIMSRWINRVEKKKRKKKKKK